MRSLTRRVGGSRTARVHRIDGTHVLRHVIIREGASNVLWRVPDENGALCAGRHDELLVGRDGNLSHTNSQRARSNMNIMNLQMKKLLIQDLPL